MFSNIISTNNEAHYLNDLIDSNNIDQLNKFISSHPTDYFFNLKLDEEKDLSLFHKIIFNNNNIMFYSILQNFLSRQKQNNESFDKLNTLLSQRDIDGNLPIHFAAYKGNIDIIIELIKLGIDYNVKNYSGLNVMHMAAQGDCPNVLIFFKDKYKMDVNEKDETGNTPLHWACYMSSESAITFILSWINEEEVNIQNKSGKTPLHIALYSDRINIIKKLINKGIDLYIKDNEGKTVFDIAKENPNLGNIFKLIMEYKNNKCIFCKTNNQENNNKNPKNLFKSRLFTFLSFSIEILTFLILLPYLQSKLITSLFIFAVVSLLISHIYMCLSDPGILKSNFDLSWLDIVLNKIDVSNICPYCKVTKNKYSKHCHICNHCVEDFDHHCNWINNCIGEKNSNEFICFLIILIINLTFNYLIALDVFLIKEDFIVNWEPIYIINFLYLKTTKDIISITTMSVCLFFVVPVCYVLYNQIKSREIRKRRNNENIINEKIY